MLDSIQHLFITGEDNDKPIAESQDGEPWQDTNDDEDNASDAHSSIQIPNPKSYPTPPAVLPPS